MYYDHNMGHGSKLAETINGMEVRKVNEPSCKMSDSSYTTGRSLM